LFDETDPGVNAVRLASLTIVAFLALASLGFAADKQAKTGKVRITQPVLFGTPE
jgi:hypothetical protein